MPRWRELKRFCERDGWEGYMNTISVLILQQKLKVQHIPSMVSIRTWIVAM